MSSLVILNEFRQVFVWKLISGNTLEFDTRLHWEVQNELNRLAYSLKSNTTLPMWGVGGLLGIAAWSIRLKFWIWSAINFIKFSFTEAQRF